MNCNRSHIGTALNTSCRYWNWQSCAIRDTQSCATTDTQSCATTDTQSCATTDTQSCVTTDTQVHGTLKMTVERRKTELNEKHKQEDNSCEEGGSVVPVYVTRANNRSRGTAQLNLNNSSSVVPVYVTRANNRSRGTAQLNLNNSNRWTEWSASRYGPFTPREIPRYLLNMRLGGPKASLGGLADEKNVVPLWDLKTDCTSCSVVTVVTAVTVLTEKVRLA